MRSFFLSGLVFFTACSGGGALPDPGSGDDAATLGDAPLGSFDGQAGSDAPLPSDASSDAPSNQGLATLGSLVVLGDSISDGGGNGPFYYDLLKQDLGKHYGTVAYQNRAQSGSKTGALASQIDSLPKMLAGPVGVCITSGGNDMKAAFPLIIAGTDGAARAQMGTNIQNALSKLLAPSRFGANVLVYVFEANIYDASDGKGDFGSHNCAFGGGVPTIPSDPFFANWNGVIATQVSAKSQTLTDIHKHFDGHGYSGNPNWFASDCTHPNTLGHDQLRRLFYLQITGTPLK